MIEYRKDFDETRFMSFLIKDDELLQKLKIVSKKNLMLNQYTIENI